MFGLFQRSRRARRPSPLPRSRPAVEQLEDRLCPAAPMFMGMSATHISSFLVVSGNIMDEAPTTAHVALTGAVAATVTPDANGHFEYIADWPGGTMVSATVTDAENLTDGTSATIQSPPDSNPYVSLSVTYGEQRQVTLSGRVYDDSPGGLTVRFSGVVSGTATTDSQGFFSVTLTASNLGMVSANVTDSTMHQSNQASVTLVSAKPRFDSFICQELTGGWYRFTGKVLDESVAGLTVYFGGTPVSLMMQSATVQADGEFTLDLQLNGTSTDEGTASAQVTDWWGKMSDQAFCDVHQTGV
jgi:hypothetical protein